MLHQLIRNARRRLLFNEVLKQFAWSAALVVGGLALLLTVGTRYLEWWVVGLFATAVIFWAAAKLRGKLPGDYAAAVWLDEKAGLHDALSTAHYFSNSPAKAKQSRVSGPEAETILLAQREQAETLASDVDVAVAVPFRFPKALYGLAALILVSSGLVAVRYFYGHQLNLSVPITEIIFQDLAAKSLAKSNGNPAKRKDYDESRSLLSSLGLNDDLEGKSDEQLDQALADALSSAAPAGADANSENQADPIDGQDSPNNEQKDADQSASANNESQAGQNASKPGDKSDKSLLSKLKDAMDSMLGKPAESGDKSSEKKDSNQKSDPGQAQNGPKDGESADSDKSTPTDGEANGNAQKSNAPGQNSANKGEKTEGPSVAGSDDGEKAVKAAEQLKAMGKISELIGKRSGQVTGESMIDVQSGDQKLRTAYKDKAATHGEGAGEVSRDQIPVSVQAYVQEYFQQVRKTSAEPAAKEAAPKP